MKTARPSNRHLADGIMLLEVLVYISVLAIVLGCGTALLYQSWGQNIALRRTTDGMISTLTVGEMWRADVRSAIGPIETTGQEFRIPTGGGIVTYSFSANVVRRHAENQPARILANVKSSQMSADTRGPIPAWRWEIELVSNPRKIQLRPLFTFQAVAPRGANK